MTQEVLSILPVVDPVTQYEKIKRIGEGTYGVVYKARDTTTGEVVALKKALVSREKDGLPVTFLRELRVLQTCRHRNLVELKKVVTGSKLDSVFIVFEYCAHDLGRLVDSMPQPFTEPQVKCIMKQLLEVLDYLHFSWVMHRDLKLCNLLLTHNGYLKLCDFGLARYFRAIEDACTPNVVTLWYRAPEILLGSEDYTEAVDMWAVGCIMGELLQHAPLFPGRSELAMLDLFVKLLGTPHEGIWPGFAEVPHAGKLKLAAQPYNYIEQEFPQISASGLDLLNRLLTYDPKKRINANKALKHVWFQQHPLPVQPRDMPTFPSTQDAVSDAGGRKDDEFEKKRADRRFGYAFEPVATGSAAKRPREAD